MTRRFHSIKDPHQERALFKRRVITVAVLMGMFALLLIVRLAYLQIYQHKLYTTLARQNLLNLSPSEPNRGLIYDRNGVLLAENVPVFNMVVTPSRVANLPDTLNALQKVIIITATDLQQFNRQLKLHRRFQPVLLRSRLTEEEVARFAVERYRFPGVVIQAQMIRHYPLGDAFAPVVGFVGRINAQELAVVDPSNYSATNFIGKTGVEKHYEELLHGKVGYQEEETDAAGQVVRLMKRVPPIAGSNLYLTIDSKLQIAAQQALNNQRGAIVAIDPRNGEVLALASGPSFDPNLFVDGISKDDYQALRDADDQPLYNRALQGRFPPGSTVKPFFALEGLSSGVITPDYTVYDPGWFQLKDSSHIYHDDLRTGHGTVNLAKAIPVSCDTYFFNLATKLGIERLDDILQRFGFGEPTGIDLDNEAAGIVPSPAWKQRKLKKSWYPGDTVITGIGQGFMLATPLQLASGVAALSMRGQRWQPHVLLQSTAIGFAPVPIKPVPLQSVQFPDDMWDLILNAMHDVVVSPIGTAYRHFQGITYTVAGKTGTAQVFSLKQNQRYHANMLPVNLRDNSVFVAFAPVDNPHIALAVMLQHSSVPAAVVARQILDFYFSQEKNS
jgi:penicillin-binding protein 2